MHSKHKRRALLASAAVVAAGTLMATSASAVLPGSTFEGNDGNFVPNGLVDWTNVNPIHTGSDLINSQQDNSFGQGTSENDVNVTVVRGSIPNSKADLAQFLESDEQAANGDIFIYLGWTRANQSGTTNFDFEINQEDQPGLLTAGPVALNRTAGDLLINYLFQGQGTPVINLRTWTGTAWSAATPLAAPIAEAAINTTQLANPFGLPALLPAGQFGETAINLTAAGVFPDGRLQRRSVRPTSRAAASTSFNSELKDFVAPVDIDIANCSTITVDKVTVPSGSTQEFTFTPSWDDPFVLTDEADPITSDDLNPGTYSVSETVPDNWTLTEAVCDDGSDPAAIDLGAAEHVTCTFTNTLNTGAISIHKDRKHAADGPGDHPHAGVEFTLNGESIGLTDANGNICVDDLTFGDYTVNELTPAGYVSADDSQDVTVDNLAFCDDDPYVGEALSFDNTPLTDVLITTTGQVAGGTASSISCVDGATTIGDPSVFTENASLAINNNVPKTLVCTIVIDP